LAQESFTFICSDGFQPSGLAGFRGFHAVQTVGFREFPALRTWVLLSAIVALILIGVIIAAVLIILHRQREQPKKQDRDDDFSDLVASFCKTMRFEELGVKKSENTGNYRSGKAVKMTAN
jgi:hypothetical protein